MANKPVRFGILGAAKIGRKICRAIADAPNATLSAIGSRSVEKASKFASDNGLSAEVKIYGSYEAVVDDPEIDAVYVPLPTSLHLRWAVVAAKKKKHLLLEKPVALNVAEFDEIAAACEGNGVQFMDGTMLMHHPRTPKIRQFLSDADQFGQLKMVNSIYTYAADSEFIANDIRIKPDLDGLGALGDVGWYCIRSILFAADFQLPTTVLALPNPVLNESGVILSCGSSLFWDDGKVATFHCSFLSNLTMDTTAIGTNGTLNLNDFVIPYDEKEAYFFTSSKSRFNELATGWKPVSSKHVVPTELSQEARMVGEFSRLVKEIKEKGSKPEKKWSSISRKTQLVIDAVKASLDRGSKVVEVGR
ncbi:uncharacterized oxidoreductase At4g09670-like [Cucurbita moschata]|uniref:Uncharacterized oxidoreductase At4g09670-like n=1 Tax=Cucurbita moschata TaxID=3662 RepID=A0A6J1FNL7_CUCMO|nr:uncharacterized oxidoreductase At4g09670-like [Cucurbita moschata]